jgi:hypothetical protein
MVPAPPYSGRMTRWVVAPLAALLIVLGAGAYNVWSALPILNIDQRRSAVVREAGERLQAAGIPSDAVVFGPAPLLNHLQFAGDYRLYAIEDFDPATLKTFSAFDPETPNGLQASRAQALAKRGEVLQVDGLRKLLRQLALRGIDAGQRVFVISTVDTLPLNFTDDSFTSLDGQSLQPTVLDEWAEPAAVLKIDRRRTFGDDAGAKWRLTEVTRGKK